MLRQYSLSLKIRFSLRVTMHMFMVVINIILVVCGFTGIYGDTVTAFTLSGLTFFAWLVVCILADYEVIKSLYSAPKGYHIFLAPVSGWKILLGRLAAILTWDISGFLIGMAGLTLLTFLYSELSFFMLFENIEPIWDIILIMIGLLYFIICYLIFFLMAALTKSIFFSKRASALWGILGGFLICYIMSWLNLILLPFTAVVQRGGFITLHISSGDYLTVVIYLVLLLLKVTTLFYITLYLTERKINI